MNRVLSWVVDYHWLRHLPLCLPHLQDKAPVPDGYDNYKLHPGFLIVRNGETTLEDMVRGGLINPELIGHSQQVFDKQDLFRYLDQYAIEDGVHVWESNKEGYLEGGHIHWVHIFANILKVAAHLLPPQFFGQRELSEGAIGNRTRLGVLLPQDLSHVECYQVKQTPVNGIGTVNHFYHGGLERVYLAPEEAGEDVQVLGKSDLIGIYQRYDYERDPQDLVTGLSLVKEQALARHLREGTAQQVSQYYA